MPGPVTSIGSGFETSPRIQSPDQAAKAFEAMFLKQLFGEMTKTVDKSGLFGGGFESDMYGDMFASAIAESAAGGSLGLLEMLEQNLGIDKRLTNKVTSVTNMLKGIGAYRATVSGDAAPPANPGLAKLAEGWLDAESGVRWGREGELTPVDLAANLSTEGAGGTARFNVLDASGYKGHPKCNLFAFEMLRRAGYRVPIRPRSHGWGYPGADAVARWSEGGKVEDWASVRSRASAVELDAEARTGKPLLLASSAPEGVAGHMAVADRIHDVKRDGNGRIAVIEYSGWEAGSKKASYGRRVWRLENIKGRGRGGLDRIEVLEPHRADGQNNYHPIGKGKPGASVLDISRENVPVGSRFAQRHR